MTPLTNTKMPLTNTKLQEAVEVFHNLSEGDQLEMELYMAADEKMTTNLYNSGGTLLGEIEISSVTITGTTTYMTRSLRHDGMTEWFDAAKLADGRRCGVMFLFTAAEMASVTDDLRWSNSQIDRVVLDSDEDDFAPLEAMSESSLAGANLRNADLRNMSLRNADLRNADLSRSNLRGADMSGANLRGADMSEAYMHNTNLSGSDMTGANLRDAYMTGANMVGANLYQADLRNANLSGANLADADMRAANMVGTNLTGSNREPSVLPVLHLDI